jgi:hypothetical protein
MDADNLDCDNDIDLFELENDYAFGFQAEKKRKNRTNFNNSMFSVCHYSIFAMKEVVKRYNVPVEIVFLIVSSMIPEECYDLLNECHDYIDNVANYITKLIGKEKYRKADKFCDDNITMIDSLVESISKRFLKIGENRDTQCFYDLPLRITESPEASPDWISSDYYNGTHHWHITSDINFFIAYRQDYAYFVTVIDKEIQTNEFPKTINNIHDILKGHNLFHLFSTSKNSDPIKANTF